MSTSAELISIGLKGLQELQALYRRDWPKYCQEYYILSNFIIFLKTKPQLEHLYAYTLSDALAQELGLFLIMDHHQLFLGCLGHSFKLLERALHQLDWTVGVTCSSIPDRYMATVEKVVRAKQLAIRFQHTNNLYLLPAKDALQLPVDCPVGYQLRPLAEDDALHIDQEWPYSYEGSLFFLQRQIRLCPSIGLYDEQTNQMVAWCIRTQDCLLAALQVDTAYKRRGFGTVVVKALSRQIAALGDDVTAEVNQDNQASSAIFNKLGFQVIDQCHWILTAPASGKFN